MLRARIFESRANLSYATHARAMDANIATAMPGLEESNIASIIVRYLGGPYSPSTLALRSASRAWCAVIPAPPPITRKALVRCAGREGLSELFEYAIGAVGEHTESHEHIPEAFNLAIYNGARYGHWEFCTWLCETRKKMGPQTLRRADLSKYSLRYGRNAREFGIVDNLVLGAARGGHTTEFEHTFMCVFTSTISVPIFMRRDFTSMDTEKAARSAHVHIIQIIDRILGLYRSGVDKNSILFGAARHGHAELFRETFADMMNTERSRIKWKYVIANALCYDSDLTIARELLERLAQDDLRASVPWPEIITMIARFGPVDYFKRAFAIAPAGTARDINWHTVRENALVSGDKDLQECVRCMQLEDAQTST